MKRDELSAVKTVHALLTGLLGASIALLTLMLFVYFFYLYKGIHYPTFGIFPVNISLFINHPNINPNAIYVTEINGKIAVANPAFLISLYFVLQTLLIYISLYYIIFLLRKITGTVINGNPFIQQNSDRLRIIALIIIVVPVFLHYCNFFMTKQLISSFKIGNILISPILQTDAKILFAILAGVLSLVFSTVLKSAVKLKEENELTV